MIPSGKQNKIKEKQTIRTKPSCVSTLGWHTWRQSLYKLSTYFPNSALNHHAPPSLADTDAGSSPLCSVFFSRLVSYPCPLAVSNRAEYNSSPISGVRDSTCGCGTGQHKASGRRQCHGLAYYECYEWYEWDDLDSSVSTRLSFARPFSKPRQRQNIKMIILTKDNP